MIDSENNNTYDVLLEGLEKMRIFIDDKSNDSNIVLILLPIYDELEKRLKQMRGEMS